MSEACIADVVTKCPCDGCENTEMDGLEWFTYFKSIDERLCSEECLIEHLRWEWKIDITKKPEYGTRYQWVATHHELDGMEFCRETVDEAADALLTYKENL